MQGRGASRENVGGRGASLAGAGCAACGQNARAAAAGGSAALVKALLVGCSVATGVSAGAEDAPVLAVVRCGSWR